MMNIYTQQSSFRRGASEAGEGVYIEYMTEADAARNKAENSSAKCIVRTWIEERLRVMALT